MLNPTKNHYCSSPKLKRFFGAITPATDNKKYTNKKQIGKQISWRRNFIKRKGESERQVAKSERKQNNK